MSDFEALGVELPAFPCKPPQRGPESGAEGCAGFRSEDRKTGQKMQGVLYYNLTHFEGRHNHEYIILSFYTAGMSSRPADPDRLRRGGTGSDSYV